MAGSYIPQAPLVHWAEWMGCSKPPPLPTPPVRLCPAGMWRHWALIFLSQQLYKMMKLFLVAVSKKCIGAVACDRGALCNDSFFFFYHLIVNGVFSECSCIQWLKSHYIFKCNYWLGSILTQYLSSALHFPCSVFLHLLSKISKEARFVNRCTIVL